MKLKLTRPADLDVPAHPASGRRILAFGPALAGLRDGPLAGARIETAGLERAGDVSAGACDLVLIDADAWEPAALSAAVRDLAGSPHPPPVLLVGARLPTAAVRNLLRLPVSDAVEAPFAPAQLDAAIAALLAPRAGAATARGAQTSRCWSVTGAVGGAGATTLAIEIATALCGRSGADRGVCLVDLNLADGAAAAYLGVQPALRLADFGADRIDAAVLQAFVTPVTKQLDLLAAPRDPAGFDAVSREAVLRTLEVACEAYPNVIVDMPRHRRSWTLEALSGCDEVLVVSELTVPALIAARSFADEVEQALAGAARPRIVLNRLASRMFGPAPSMAEAERALQRKADAGISSDWEAAAASANLGGPIAQHRPKSKIVKDVAALVARLAEGAARKDDAQAAKAA